MSSTSVKKFVRNPHKGISLHAGEIIGVWLSDNESVEWTGYESKDGTFVVTGYTIIKEGKNER